jgi:hypothetical protein
MPLIWCPTRCPNVTSVIQSGCTVAAYGPDLHMSATRCKRRTTSVRCTTGRHPMHRRPITLLHRVLASLATEWLGPRYKARVGPRWLISLCDAVAERKLFQGWPDLTATRPALIRTVVPTFSQLKGDTLSQYTLRNGSTEELLETWPSVQWLQFQCSRSPATPFEYVAGTISVCTKYPAPVSGASDDSGQLLATTHLDFRVAECRTTPGRSHHRASRTAGHSKN